MIKRFEETGVPQIMVEKVPHEAVKSYGIVDIGKEQLKEGASVPIKSIVEKPEINEAPSDYAVVGRYVLPAEIWQLFKRTPEGAGGEFQLTDTIELLMKIQEVDAFAIKGCSHDCGNKLGYVKTFIEYAARNETFGKEVKEFLKTLEK